MRSIIYSILVLVSFFTSTGNAISFPLNNSGAMPPVPYGIIYSRNNWNSVSDFITNGNTTAALNGGYVNISSATQDDWNNIIHITGYRTKLEKWRFKLRFKIMAWSGSSYGLGFGLKSANEYVQNDIMGFIQTSNTGNGGLYIVKSGRTIVASGAAPLGVALNDVIDLDGEFYDSVFHFTAHNISSGNTALASFTFATNGSTYVVPNTSNFSLMELGGTHQIQNIEISSEELTGGNIVTIGDSKTIGYFSNSFSGRYAAQLNTVYPAALINAGGADRITHVLSRQEEIIKLAPNKYLLNIGSNDLRFGSAFTEVQHNYDSLVQLLLATGAKVYHIVLPEDYTKALGVNTTPLKDWIAATYPAYYINAWDSMANGNLLKGIYDTGDGVHINQAGNDKIYEAIVASNKLSSGVLAVRLISFAGRRINRNKAQLNWKLDPFQQADSYTILRSPDGIQFKEIATVGANSNAVYTFDDNALMPGTNYYKLIMIENTGDTTESKIVAVTNNQKGLEFTGWQRSTADDLIFSMNSFDRLLVSWYIIDVSGRVMQSSSSLLHPGANQVRVNTAGMTGGVYYFKINGPGRTEQYVCSFVK